MDLAGFFSCFLLVFMAGLPSAPGALERTATAPAQGEWDLMARTEWTADQAEGRYLTRGRVVVDEAGRTFFLERQAGRVLFWNAQGELLGGWGRKGEGPGEFKIPVAIHATAGRVGVQEVDRLNLFSPQGVLEKTLSFEPSRAPVSLNGLEGYAFVGPDQEGRRVLGVAAWEKKEPVTLGGYDQGTHASRGMIVAGLEYPVACTDGRIYASFPQDCAITCHTAKGEPVWKTTLPGRTRARISREEKIARIGSKRWEQLKAYTSNGRPAGEALLDTMPDQEPFFAHLCVLEGGWILALEPSRNHQLRGDLFDPRGGYRYRCRLSLPEGCLLQGRPGVHRDRMVLIWENGEGDLELASLKMKLPPR